MTNNSNCGWFDFLMLTYNCFVFIFLLYTDHFIYLFIFIFSNVGLFFDAYIFYFITYLCLFYFIFNYFSITIQMQEGLQGGEPW